MHSPEVRHRLDELFRSYYPAVLAYARRRASLITADDVAAETFAVAWRRVDDIPVDALPWLLGVARRVLATQRRSAGRQLRLEQRLRAVEPRAGEEQTPGLGLGLGEALAALSELDREAILLVAWEGLTTKQAAAVLGTTVTGFAVRLHRARRRLRVQLEQTEGPPVRDVEPRSLAELPAARGGSP